MGYLNELRVLYPLALKPVRGVDHAARLDSFYAGQAAAYDAFRARLLPGRADMTREVAAGTPDGGTWVDLGGGTGGALDAFGPAVERLGRIHVVDLSEALLAVARQRIAERALRNVEAVRADVTTWRLPPDSVDAVTLSYTLTMIPDWFRAIENAHEMLRPDGIIGVADFYVARKHPTDGRARHGWATRTLWPAWFAFDDVQLSPDHLPLLQSRFKTVRLVEGRSRLPYLPFRAPYFTFIGRKSE